MNTKLLLAVSLVSSCALAKYHIVDLHQITKAAPKDVYAAMNYLDGLERDFDADWQIYHEILPRLINQHNYKVGCEIGVSFGTHCKKILQTTDVEKLYGIDPYLNYGDPTNTVMPDLYFDVFYYKVQDKLSVFGDRFKLMRDFSVTAALNFSDESLDFIFLDANHTYRAVLADLNSWYSKVRVGGILAGDDYATCHPGVPQAVNEFFGKKGLKVNTDSAQPRLWWVEKR
ncbi:hypothetical protein BH09DEP1_BH09DEP1_7830 [soil metagenome]